jgi:hypothetical protein
MNDEIVAISVGEDKYSNAMNAAYRIAHSKVSLTPEQFNCLVNKKDSDIIPALVQLIQEMQKDAFYILEEMNVHNYHKDYL